LQGQEKNETIRIAGGESINKIMREMKGDDTCLSMKFEERKREESSRLPNIGVGCQLFISLILVKCSLVNHVSNEINIRDRIHSRGTFNQPWLILIEIEAEWFGN